MLSVLLFINYNKLISRYKKSIYYARNDRVVAIIINALYDIVHKFHGKMEYISGLDYNMLTNTNYWLNNFNS